MTENFDRAVSIFEKHLADASALVVDAATKFDYYLASWFLLDALAERGRRALKLRVPRTLPAHAEDGTYAPATLAAWFMEQCEALAAQFNARNESDYHTRRIRETDALKQLTTPRPLREAECFTT